MDTSGFFRTLNTLSAKRVPFLFFIDFELKKPQVFPLHEIDPDVVLYHFGNKGNFFHEQIKPHLDEVYMVRHPVHFEQYCSAFHKLKYHLLHGNSFLVNLTWKTPVQLPVSLRDCFMIAAAPYKLWYADQFVVFSPEPFVRISGNRISSFPMKGTIDATRPQAAETILSDEKEMAEHVTIVDLIRNDISQVARQVRVQRFRYVEAIQAGHKKLLQVSSEITGVLPENWQEQVGDILVALLPAGSVSGAPKAKTVEIIREIEGEDRGYYSGVMGLFDGYSLDSAVMIRFIEKKDDQFFYRSGGGITARSNARNEYEEMLEKIYLPCSQELRHGH